MMNGIKVFLISLLIMAFAGSIAFASDTRITTMGGVESILHDNSNIWVLPQTITKYSNLLTGEIDSRSGLYSVGGNYAIGSGVLGLYLNNTDLESFFAPEVDDSIDTYDQKIDLFYGWDMNGTVLGGHLSYYGNSHEMDANNDKSIQSVTGFGIDLGATFAENLELAFNYKMVTWTYENANADMITEPKGNSEFGLGGRYWIEMSSSYTIVPYAGFTKFGEGIKRANHDEWTVSGLAINLGIGNNMNIDDNILAVTDIGFAYEKATFKHDRDERSDEENASGVKYPYFKLGLEAELTSWMDFRMGVSKSWIREFDEDNNGKDTEMWGYADTDLFLGTAFHFGNLDIDAQIDPKFLTRGPNFISGQSGNLASRISLKYIWD
ncbi:MAG: hypothetical protein HN356_00600 [Calditrichaeota bacterium]|jgi:hypothetical protein|nr:hypothetical protein [Calditrichota bacterium]